MFWLAFVAIVCLGQVSGARQFIVLNANSFRIWLLPYPLGDSPPLDDKLVKLESRESKTYRIPDSGWHGQIWPRSGCFKTEKCSYGSSVEPCPKAGCTPPADTKIEMFFPPINSTDEMYYEINLIDGYTNGAQIVPYKNRKPVTLGTCQPTNCKVNDKYCPRNETNGVGDLKVGANFQCFSPCLKYTYKPPGLGNSDQEGVGKELCCPDPVTAEECRSGIVANTDYVKYVHQECPNGFSYRFDDNGKRINCPNDIDLIIGFSSNTV